MVIGKWAVLALGLCLTAVPATVHGAEEADVWVDTVECRNLSEAGQYIFPEVKEMDGISYRLKRTEILASAGTPVTDTSVRTEIRSSGLLLPGEVWEPEETIEKEGVMYRLMETREERARVSGRAQNVEGQVSYLGEGVKPEIPQAAEFAIDDAVTGERKLVTVPLVRTEEHWRWQDDFQTVLTAEPAGAAEYSLAGEVVRLGEEEPGLAGHEPAVLKTLGLDPDGYQIERMDWAGPAYTENGRMMRDIQVSGARHVADYVAYYSGMVPLDDIWGTITVSLYQAEVKEEIGFLPGYTVKAYYQPEEEKSSALPLAAAGSSAGLLLAGIFFWRRKKRKKE